MTEVAETDPLAGFAALMASAGAEAQPVADTDGAPYGYTRDEATGEMRPKKSPGRPRKSPSLEDLKARREAAGTPETEQPPGDRAPSAPGGRRRRASRDRAPDRPPPPVPQSLRAEGAIARAVNAQYRKVGRLVRVMDPEVGNAIIACTRAEAEDDVTVGHAWEELARTNPRVKAFLLRMLARGAVGQLLWAHTPIFGAILMKDAIRRRIPFARLAMAMVEDDGEDGGEGGGEAPGEGGPFGGLRQEDMAQMMAMAQATAAQFMSRAQDGPVRGDGLPGV